MNFVGQVKQKLSVTKTKLTTMAYRPFRGMTLTRQYPRWQHRNLQRVLFSDESRFQLFRADGMTRIYRSARERIAPCCVQETVSIGGGSVMVWWGICGQQRTDLIVIDDNLTAHRYINLLPFFQHQPRLLFQQDIARPHTARVVKTFFAANNVNVLPWSSCSPDLSSIEHLWDHLGQRILRRTYPSMNRDPLVQALTQEWRAIPDAFIRRLTNPVRYRVHA